jgi:hypothetical protein
MFVIAGAAKQSRSAHGTLDCLAPLAMTGIGFARTERRGRWLWLAILLALTLAACHSEPRYRAAPGPALWQVTGHGTTGWLFGTVHAAPRDDPWLTRPIAQAAARADRLILEATGLAEERASGAVFDRLGRRPGLPPIAARLAPADRALLADAPLPAHALDGYESWAAALLIAGAARPGLDLSSEAGGEAVLERLFRTAGKPVGGLETIDQQLGLFDRLPEPVQRRFLVQSLRESREAPRAYRALIDPWLRGDLTALEKAFGRQTATDPALAALLIGDRNRRWAGRIDALLRSGKARPFIAVGAGHMIGPDALPRLLAARGYRVRRIA